MSTMPVTIAQGGDAAPVARSFANDECCRIGAVRAAATKEIDEVLSAQQDVQKSSMSAGVLEATKSKFSGVTPETRRVKVTAWTVIKEESPTSGFGGGVHTLRNILGTRMAGRRGVWLEFSLFA